MSDRVRIENDDLYSVEVENALEVRRELAKRVIVSAPELSPAREFFMSPLFYLPIAGLLGAFLTWFLVEPHFDDFEVVAGKVALVEELLPYRSDKVIAVTIGRNVVNVHRRETKMEAGEAGEPALISVDDIEVGMSLEASGIAVGTGEIFAMGLRPAADDLAAVESPRVKVSAIEAPALLLFTLTAMFVATALLVAEGISTRNGVRMTERVVVGAPLAFVFAGLGLIPGGMLMTATGALVEAGTRGDSFTIHTLSPGNVLLFIAGRSAAWAAIGAAMGVGMNLVRSTKVQLRNSVIGGALGGAFGGMFFDPIQRFFIADSAFVDAAASRAVGLMAVGVGVGFFVALVERFGREAWLRVRTGPLAGKSFVIYRTPTVVGSSPRADVYLFKDAGIDGTHAAVHRVGDRFEIEDQSSRSGTFVQGEPVRRRRLSSGDQIVVGDTVLEFVERVKE